MTANARVLEHAIRKMLSHELAEVRLIGQQIKDAARAEVPTLVKYAEVVPYLIETRAGLGNLQSSIQNHPSDDWCVLVDYDADGEQQVLAAALYRYGDASLTDALEHVQALSSEGRTALADSLLKRLGEHDIPLRELEYCTYTFDLVMDQGAYAEFKRHRMMTQTPQRLTTRLGYAVPRLITEAGFGSAYEAAMQQAAETFEELAGFSPDVAQYIVPNGYNRRVLARFNLREAYHFCQLRAARNAHFSIRRVARRMHAEMARVHPLLTRYMQLPEETLEAVEQGFFSGM